MTESSELSAPTSPAIPDWRLRDLPPLNCPMCGYDLTQNPVPTCPECGYCLTREDIQLNTKRLACLELTRYSAIRRHVLCTIAMALFVPYVGLFLALPPILSMLAIPHLGMKGTVGRLRRRVWLMASAWLHVPWIVVGSAGIVYEWLIWKSSFMYALGAPVFLMEYPKPLLLSAASAVFISSILIWRRSLRRLSKSCGINPDDPILLWNVWATRIAVVAYLIAAFGILLDGMLWTLDTIWPGWA